MRGPIVYVINVTKFLKNKIPTLREREFSIYVDSSTYKCKKIELIWKGNKSKVKKQVLKIQATRLLGEGFRIPSDMISEYFYRNGEKTREIKIKTFLVDVPIQDEMFNLPSSLD